MDWKIKPSKRIKGEIKVPPDKSVSHRAVMFGAIAKGDLEVSNFLRGEDCLCTLEAFRSLGVDIESKNDRLLIHGRGIKGLKAPAGPIYMGNSGTSMRIISGILAGQAFTSVLTGDESLSRRPMKRIIEPLSMMGAMINPLEGGEHAPLEIHGRKTPLSPIDYTTKVASAQVKSCVLAAGLYADGVTSLTEPFQSRDHTERMLGYFSAKIIREGLTTRITGLNELSARNVDVPGDISSAAFFMVAASILEGSALALKDVGLNDTRTGIIDVLKRMGARIVTKNRKEGVEPIGDLEVKYSDLVATTVEPKEIPLLIDEIPVLLVAAAVASGNTVIKGIAELKVKETDRVKSMRHNLSKIGVEIEESGDSLIVHGKKGVFKKAEAESFGDHRTAMSMAVASLLSDGECVIRDTGCVSTSYPNFLKDLYAVAY